MGFLRAGATRVVANLACADDMAAAAFMERFHAKWRSGAAAATALREAQTHVRSLARWSHPFYWAGWTLVGDPE